MHCDHFVSSENLLNQNEICNWSGWSEVTVKIQNLPDQFYTRWKIVKTQLCARAADGSQFDDFFCPYIILLCHILILHI